MVKIARRFIARQSFKMGKVVRAEVLRVTSAIAISLLGELKKNISRKINRRKRRWWIREWVQRRPGLGASETIMKELALEDSEMYRNVLRMSKQKFNMLLDNVKPLILKQATQLREALPACIKLQITLRYLATGDRFNSLTLLECQKLLYQNFYRRYCRQLFRKTVTGRRKTSTLLNQDSFGSEISVAPLPLLRDFSILLSSRL